MPSARRAATLALLCLVLTGCSRLVDVRMAEVEATPVDVPAQSVVYAADGTPIATLRLANRVLADREELPDVLVAAVVAAEDRRFFHHRGVDGRAIARAAIANRRAGRIVQGGSTITQQLVKNRYFPEGQDTIERKLDEAVLALELEREHSKDEILVDYLNTIYFGAGAHGVKAAADVYFGVEVGDLTTPQAALLAGLIRAPESASPYREPERALDERARVLDAMAETGALSAAAASAARQAPLGVRERPPSTPTRYPYFVEHVKRVLADEPVLGEDEAARLRRLFGGGLHIHTTLDPRVQAHAEAAARAFLPEATDPEVAIAVVEHHSGHLLASVGGRDFAVRQFDLAVQGRRQPGSLLKPVALAAALQEGVRLDDLVDSGPFVHHSERHEPWVVTSAARGRISVREALASSSNGAFARLALTLGPDRIVQQAQRLGIDADLGSNPAMVLGGVREGVSPLQMASAYGTFAAGGVRQPVELVTRITDGDGRVLYEPTPEPMVAFDSAVAWTTLDALRTVVDEGTGLGARLGVRPSAGKTGTSQDNRDAWFVGSTPELTAAVWVGHPDRERPMHHVHGVARVDGGSFPAWIWRQLMLDALDGTPVRDFAYPAHLEVSAVVDPTSGGLATRWCPLTEEVRDLPTNLPTTYCQLHGPPPPEPTATPTPTPTVTSTASPTASASPTPSPTATTSPTPGASTTASPTPSATPTSSPSGGTPSVQPTPTPTPSAKPTPTPTPSPEPSP